LPAAYISFAKLKEKVRASETTPAATRVSFRAESHRKPVVATPRARPLLNTLAAAARGAKLSEGSSAVADDALQDLGRPVVPARPGHVKGIIAVQADYESLERPKRMTKSPGFPGFPVIFPGRS